MDFFQIGTKEAKGKKGEDDVLEVRPDFTVARAKDLMVQGGAFYAVWDDERGLWSRDEYDVVRLVDDEIRKYVREAENKGASCSPKYLRVFSNGGWKQFRTFLKNVSDNSHPLDTKLTFANTVVKKNDYASRRLQYSMAEGDHSAWDELLDTLYSPEEREKIEWAIGAIISGDAKKIEKFLVFYGPGGTGKSTVMKIVQKIFGGLVKEGGYVATFDAKALVGNSNSFATSAFRDNPLVAIQHDGNLSEIADSSRLNSVISHEDMTINEKYKATYDNKINAFLFMGTNKPVKITDAKSGIIRRLIDVHPTGKTFEPDHYYALMARIDFELGAIAQHCLDTYRRMGKNYYSEYRPLEMMLTTDPFFNFIEHNFDIFKEQDGTTLKQAYELYKKYCDDSEIDRGRLPQYKFREELRNYFDEFKDRVVIDGMPVRSYFSGFTAQAFKTRVGKRSKAFSLVLEETTSLLDEILQNQPAQIGRVNEFGKEVPEKYWSGDERLINGVLKKPKPSQICATELADLDTSQLHFVKLSENHIVIDFDLKDKNGEKSLELNLKAASEWPATYAELSQSGTGVHLHYIYDGNVSELASVYSEGIEIKTLLGDASLRRRLTKCNNVPVAKISSGLPFKEKKNVLPTQTIQSEKGLREFIQRNLNKEFWPGTKPSLDFIKKAVDDFHESGKPYDISDLYHTLTAFANNSSNQPLPALKVVTEIKWKSEDTASAEVQKSVAPKDDRIAPFDVEVFPNLFVVCWKFLDNDVVVKMINPSPAEIEGLLLLKLVGFYNRGYDNHILYARMMGYSIEELYKLSKKLVSGERGATFGAAYDISYTDVHDFITKKQSLKKYEIELGIRHMELDHPWDKPVPEERWAEVAEYCANDVIATEAVFKARRGDWEARLILTALSGLTPNHTTQKLTAEIIFNGDRSPQRKFVYTDLSTEFPGYVHDFGKSTYREEVVGEGGYVHAEPGMYEEVGLWDAASMHPTSIVQLNLFGPYTARFEALLQARLAIKRAMSAFKVGDDEAGELYLSKARLMLDGKLAPYLEDRETISALVEALKISINIVYGLTSAKFDNPFRDPRNKDNIVAKRGALFMIDLKHMVQEAGFQVVHIKTDSIKIPGAPDWLVDQIIVFGKKYGYDLEHEATYDKFCLVNDAVYVAREDVIENKLHKGEEYDPNHTILGKWKTKWTAVGAQFQHPYVYKMLFDPGPNAEDKEIAFDDLCETKQVSKGSIYIDFNSNGERDVKSSEEMMFIGRTGRFVPVREGFGGGVLYRVNEGKFHAVSGTKGHLWHEASVARNLPPEAIDTSYFEGLANSAVLTIEKFGSYEDFIS